MTPLTAEVPAGALERVRAHPFWYHTIDVAPGVTTPGWFDLRAALARIPLPDVRGRRCLDVGTFDGFFAFELERRGAAEVVATDIEDHTLWDWPPDAGPEAGGEGDRHAAMQGPPKGAGFRLLAELTGSRVAWRPVSVYDLDPDELGTFDVVVCGSLMLHLRDPVRALEAIRRVTAPDGRFVSSEQIELWTSIVGRRQPRFKLDGSGEGCRWWLANATGHAHMLFAAGFEVLEKSRFYLLEFNRHGGPTDGRKGRAHPLAQRLAHRALTGGWGNGILHRAVVGRPRL